MAQVDGQVYLIRLGNVELRVPLMLHEHGDKLIADFRCVLRVVGKTELLLLHALLKLRVVLDLDVLALDLFRPAELVQALSEQDGVGDDYTVEVGVHTLRDFPQVYSEDFIDKHSVSLGIIKIVIIVLPKVLILQSKLLLLLMVLMNLVRWLLRLLKEGSGRGEV